MDKRKWYTILLLWLIQLSSAGQYISHGETFSRACIFGFLDMVIVSIIMMIIPFIIRCRSGKLLEYNYGRKICTWNSVGVFIISIFINIMTDGKYAIIGGLGALAYYYINMWIFVIPRDDYENQIRIHENDFELNKNSNENIEKNTNELKTNANIEKEEIKEETKEEINPVNKKYCTKCGKQIENNWMFCNYCGNKLK